MVLPRDMQKGTKRIHDYFDQLIYQIFLGHEVTCVCCYIHYENEAFRLSHYDLALNHWFGGIKGSLMPAATEGPME